jgi:hypothetical protein
MESRMTHALRAGPKLIVFGNHIAVKARLELAGESANSALQRDASGGARSGLMWHLNEHCLRRASLALCMRAL